MKLLSILAGALFALNATHPVAEQPEMASQVTIYVAKATTITVTNTITELGPTTSAHADISSLPHITSVGPAPSATLYGFDYNKKTTNNLPVPSGLVNNAISAITDILPAFEQWFDTPIITPRHLLLFALAAGFAASWAIFRRDYFNRVYANNVFESLLQRIEANSFLFWTILIYILHVLSGRTVPFDPMKVFADRLVELHALRPCWPTKLLQFIPIQYRKNEGRINSSSEIIWLEIRQPLADTGLVCLRYFGRTMAYLPIVTEFLLNAFTTIITFAFFFIGLIWHGCLFLFYIAYYTGCGFCNWAVVPIYNRLHYLYNRLWPTKIMVAIELRRAKSIKDHESRLIRQDAANMGLESRIGMVDHIRAIESVLFEYNLDKVVTFRNGMVFKRKQCVPYEEWVLLQEEESPRGFIC